MIRSYVRMQLHRGDRRHFESERNPYQAGEAIWFACNSNIEGFLGSLPADRKHAIRYEDLTATPSDSLQAICNLLEVEFQPRMANPYAKPGAAAQGAGDPHINLMTSVEHRRPMEPFFELGGRCQELATRHAY